VDDKHCLWIAAAIEQVLFSTSFCMRLVSGMSRVAVIATSTSPFIGTKLELPIASISTTPALYRDKLTTNTPSCTTRAGASLANVDKKLLLTRVVAWLVVKDSQHWISRRLEHCTAAESWIFPTCFIESTINYLLDKKMLEHF